MSKNDTAIHIFWRQPLVFQSLCSLKRSKRECTNETFVPIVTYASDVITFSSKEMQSLHVAVNDAVRKIFSYQRWESIRTLRESLGYLSVTDIFSRRKRVFENRLPQIGNALLSFLARN